MLLFCGRYNDFNSTYGLDVPKFGNEAIKAHGSQWRVSTTLETEKGRQANPVQRSKNINNQIPNQSN
jgi:hypothetical protein